MAKNTDQSTKNQNTQDQGHQHDHTHQNTGLTQHPEIGENTQVNFTVEWSVIDAACQRVLRKYQPHVKADGFRKGKAPLSVVEQMVGQQRLYQEVAEQVVPGAYVKAIQDAKLTPIADPDIHIEKMDHGEEWKFHAHIAEKPTVKLGRYKDLATKALKEFETVQKNASKMNKDDKKEGNEEKKEPTAEQIREQKLDAILAKLRGELKPVIPELLVRQEATRLLQQLERYLKAYQISAESYFKSTGKTAEQVQQEFAGQALATWQIEMILDAIATEENLSVPDEEVMDTLHKNARGNETQFTEADKRYTQSLLKKKKVFDFLISLEK